MSEHTGPYKDIKEIRFEGREFVVTFKSSSEVVPSLPEDSPTIVYQSAFFWDGFNVLLKQIETENRKLAEPDYELLPTNRQQ